MICENINYCKTGKSKVDNCSYKFEYIEELPEKYYKSADNYKKKDGRRRRKKKERCKCQKMAE